MKDKITKHKLNEDDVLEILTEYLAKESGYGTFNARAILLGTPCVDLRAIVIIGELEDESIDLMDLDKMDREIKYTGTHSAEQLLSYPGYDVCSKGEPISFSVLKYDNGNKLTTRDIANIRQRFLDIFIDYMVEEVTNYWIGDDGELYEGIGWECTIIKVDEKHDTGMSMTNACNTLNALAGDTLKYKTRYGDEYDITTWPMEHRTFILNAMQRYWQNPPYTEYVKYNLGTKSPVLNVSLNGPIPARTPLYDIITDLELRLAVKQGECEKDWDGDIDP
jgi:hypothetical protein